jgi:tetratricopeptide (TPR) repeat protein
MNVTLQLRYSPAPLREAAAWFIPGDEPRAWSAEMTSWSVPLAGAKLCPLSLREQTPFRGAKGDNDGVIVMLTEGVQPAQTTIALPYGKVAGRLLLPVEAALDPPLSEQELAGLLPAGNDTFVWHPIAGLVRLAEFDALAVASLLSPPAASNREFAAAQPGFATNTRLLSVEPSERPSLEDVMEAGRGDIGTQPMAGGGLPQAPGEPAGGAIGRAITSAGLSAAAGAAELLASAAQALSNLTGGGSGAANAPATNSPRQTTQKSAGSSGPNFLQRLADWARQRQKAMRQNLDQLRNNQIERLLHSLHNSPDQGLRFALPLTGTGAPRGLAPPGARLTARNVNFNLNRLGGGAAADFWDVSEDYRRKLAQRYRELANREIALGRHRRAAYILAELLGDLSSAAATLANGGHFREAALLYEERLKQPLAAARCLQRGGLLTEAVALFEKLGEHETAGDLYRQLDQPEPAEQSYRRAVTRLVAAFDHLGAARVIENKLHDADDALRMLLNGWRGATAQAERCLDASFSLLARQQQHERAEELVAEVAGQTPANAVTQAGSLTRIFTTYPHDSVKDAAKSATRVLVSRNLPTATTGDSEALLRALQQIVPADRLLKRDCQRYQDRRAELERRRLAARPRTPVTRQPRLVSSFRLPWGKWKAAVSAGDEFYAAGFHNNWLIAVRGRWDGAVQLPIGDPAVVPAEATDSPVFLAADPRGLGSTYLHVAPHHTQRELQFACTEKFPRVTRVCPVWGAEQPLEGLTYGLGHSLLLLTLPEAGRAQVASYDKSQRLEGVQTIEFYHLDFDETYYDFLPRSEDGLTRPLPFFSREQSLYLGIGPWLISKGSLQHDIRLASPIRSITGSAPHTRARIIVACEQGGYVLWGDAVHSANETRFAQDMHRPVVGLTRGGWLVAATRGELEVFSTHDGRLSYFGRSAEIKHDPLAILPTTDANRFAVLTVEGSVTIYEVPQ